MTKLAHQLGLSTDLEFHDVYSLTDREMISFLPRPAMALLFVYPESETQRAATAQEDEDRENYNGFGPDEPIIFYPQTIHHSCGLIGLLHCLVNNPAAGHIATESELDKLRNNTIPLKPESRAKYIHDSESLEKAHAVAAQTGDSIAPPLGEDPGHAFVAFVKGSDGHLYELAGFRKGPIDRGLLTPEEDVLSERSLSSGVWPYLTREREAPMDRGVLNFSCIMLGPKTQE
jgi:ubiquitin carboxyl-terminal hydrolase L3